MAFDVSALTDYVKQEADNLVAATLLAPRTCKLVSEHGTVLTGVKSREQIGNMETDAVFQDGSSCGFNSSGSTVFSKREVVVGSIKINEAICPKDLEKKYTQKMLSIGSSYADPSTFNYYRYWAERKVAKAGQALEVACWQGDTESANGQLNRFDGFIKHIATGAGAVIDANATAYGLAAPITVASGGITKGNILSILDAIFMAIPTQLLESEDCRVFLGYDLIRLASIAGRDSKYFQYTTEIANGEIIVPGTNLKVVALGGLNGTKGAYAMRMSNMFCGTDLEGEDTAFDVWYSKDDDNVKYKNVFKYGTQLGVISEVVKFEVK